MLATKVMPSENLISSWRLSLYLLAIYCCAVLADTANLQESLCCTTKDLNSVPSNTITSLLTVDIASIFNLLVEFNTISRIICAFICSKLEANGCHAITYDESNQSCKLYTWDFNTSVNQTLADPRNKYCWKTKVLEFPSSFNSSQIANTAIVMPAGLASCSGGSSLTTYTQPSASCPAVSNCVCDRILNAVCLSGYNKANDCFTKCSSNANCLAFAYYPGCCYIATTTSQLTLINSPDAITCYCNKPATTTVASTTKSTSSVTVNINGATYYGLSCYPQKLFSGTSYLPKIPIGGRQADCRCGGGLYLQSGTSVSPAASTFAQCFAACEQVAAPPCKAFAFMEANKTCVVGATSSNSDSSDKGVIQCTT